MNYIINDFILEDRYFFDKEECNAYIKYYNHLDESGFTYNRKGFKHHKDDKAFSYEDLNGIISEDDASSQSLLIAQNQAKHFIDKFWNGPYEEYRSKFSILNVLAKHNVYSLKLQKTLPGQGYHVWHTECDNRIDSNRLLTFLLYLNDVEEGGETEFLYYSRRIKAEAGKLVLFPGSFSHTHRGNPPLRSEKYLITGWVYFE